MPRALLPALCVLVTAGSAAGQPFPMVTTFPIELKRAPANFTAQDRAALDAEFERLLRKSGADVPDSAQYAIALRDLKRQDCDRDDECLKQLAQLAHALYALYVELDNTLGGNVVATGRVVRADGVAMGRSKVVTLPKLKKRYTELAHAALTKLLAELEIGNLPPQRTVTTDVPKVETPPNPVAVVVPPPVTVVTPPPVVVVQAPAPRKGLRHLAWIPGTIGGVAAVGAGVTYALAFSLHQQLATGTWTSGPDAAAAARSGDLFQWTSAIATGVAVVSAAVMLWFLLTPGDAAAPLAPSAGPSPAVGAFTW